MRILNIHFHSNRWLLSAFIFFLIVINSSATNYYVDPLNGDMSNAGDSENSWSTLEQVFDAQKSFAAGDTIFLLNGHHGAPTITGQNTDFVTIMPLQGHSPTIEKITFSSAENWYLKGITISPETAPEYNQSTLIQIKSNASHIIIEDCFCYSVEDNSPWSKEDWVSNACSGASISGNNNVLRGSHFLNVDHGIFVNPGAENNLVEYNVIENFSGDGMRGIGNYNTFQYNTIKNCYDVDENHDDGFQSYSYSSEGVGKSTVYRIVLRGNLFINYTDLHQKFRGTLQGIGCFDGMFEDWLIENNVVITDHWHGTSLYGA